VPWISTIAWSDADGVLREAYDWQAASLGEPTEFTQLGSLYPELVMERLRLYKVVEGAPSSLSALERRVAAYVTSTLNETPHCASGLVHRLADLGVPVERLAEARRSDPRLDAIASYAEKLTRQPDRMQAVDIERLREVGLEDLDILDLNNIVAYFNYINRVANGLGLKTAIPAEHARRAVPR
jgi:uncharacterized peroxidase-related enzyme